MTPRSPTVYSIPAGIPFATCFAAKLLQQNASHPESLPAIQVFLPNRRACRIVRDEFLRLSAGSALLLPRLKALGDLDEDGLGMEIAALSGPQETVTIPPALAPLRRQIILTRLILARDDHRGGPEQALLMAQALGRLMDRIHTEGKKIGDLPALAGDEFAAHWNITLKFLTILSENWPQILAGQGCIEATERRNRLLLALAAHWEKDPPQSEIYAAGSTGSIPAAARLLRVIACLPRGALILPGLDPALDERSWEELGDSHPQVTLKTLLASLGVDRQHIPLWQPDRPVPERVRLAGEIMRPAATTEHWRNLAKNRDELQSALTGVERIDCATAQEEARVISLLFRRVQHRPGQTAALVTFNRDLARRVAAACGRWGLVLDDSAGLPLTATATGGFLSLIAQACLDDLAPVPLLALLKHSHSAAGQNPAELRFAVRRLERAHLRGPRPDPGLSGLRHRAEKDPGLMVLIDRLEPCLGPLLALQDSRLHSFADFISAHLRCAEALAATPQQKGAERLWCGDDGAAAALFFAELQGQVTGFPDLDLADYTAMLKTMMDGIVVRPAWGTHPRLMILGPLEARLIQADLMILGGLNEGSWPPAPETDPWMSRPMRSAFGLPSPERGIGLSAHDFVQGFCAPQVILTRSARQGTSPTIPSRWLQRLDTVIEAAGLSLHRTDWLEKANALDRSPATLRLDRPMPRPPVEKRPVRLSVTEIGTWMQDPYALYAKHVLSLKSLDPIDQFPNVADRGTILHKAFEEFVRLFPERLPSDAYEQLWSIGHNLLDQEIDDVRTRHFWGVRFDKAADWFIQHERTWRMAAKPFLLETTGEMALPDHAFTLTGKADRMDIFADGSGLAIIDYKTGSCPSETHIQAGLSPQLPLEAAMIRAGAFPGITEEKIAYLGHWMLGGGNSQCEKKIKADPDDLADQALDGLKTLVTAFARETTPYLSLPRLSLRPRHSPYTHLARVQEWAVLDESHEGEA